ncbi:MAG: hypothetical protein LBI28_05595 [Treponema sp.]|nr:hypothetical protein [Treponema sp.]
MKKLTAIAVVFALAAGGVFAADLGASIFGTVNLLQGDTNEKADDDLPGVFGSGNQGRLRLEGSGENDDGTFGAWYRWEPTHWDAQKVFGIAWWKPIDQFKLSIGGNPDGIYAKEGYAGWMFHQTANDSGVVCDDQAWGAPYAVNGEKMRDAFYGGFGGNALMLDIKPVDMFGLNIVLPYFEFGSGKAQGQGLGEVFKNMTIQVDVNMDFGNIALTFDMAPWTKDIDKPNGAIGGKFYLYFGLTAIENLNLDFSVGLGLPKKVGNESVMEPIGIGLAAKYAINDAFGIKARVLAKFGGKYYQSFSEDDFTEDELAALEIYAGILGIDLDEYLARMGGLVDNPFGIIFDVLPYYAISDSFTVFADIGINMMAPKGGDSVLGFHFNPYIQIGQEWGPSFFAGVKVWTNGKVGDKTPINFAIPIGLEVSF